MNVEKNASMPVNQTAAKETLVKKESEVRYTSESYQKILDYHVSEILLTTIVFGIILLIRLHR